MAKIGGRDFSTEVVDRTSFEGDSIARKCPHTDYAGGVSNCFRLN